MFAVVECERLAPMFRAVGEHDKIARRDISRNARIVIAMDEIRLPEDPLGAEVFVSAKPNEVDRSAGQ